MDDAIGRELEPFTRQAEERKKVKLEVEEAKARVVMLEQKRQEQGGELSAEAAAELAEAQAKIMSAGAGADTGWASSIRGGETGGQAPRLARSITRRWGRDAEWRMEDTYTCIVHKEGPGPIGLGLHGGSEIKLTEILKVHKGRIASQAEPSLSAGVVHQRLAPP